MENKEKKVLLRISNLKQYFPLKKGRFVKANDGITLDIYEGETFGLVGESGCGKSTLGRTILQLYHQTYGRTMYYGRSLDDLAPKYVTDTVKHLKKRRQKLHELEEKRDKLEAQYAKLSEKEQYSMHAELDAAEALFAVSHSFAESEDGAEFRANTAELLTQLRLLDEMEEISIKNIL